MISDTYARSVRIIPQASWEDFARNRMPPKTELSSPGHMQEWVAACKGGPAAGANFDYAGPSDRDGPARQSCGAYGKAYRVGCQSNAVYQPAPRRMPLCVSNTANSKGGEIMYLKSHIASFVLFIALAVQATAAIR
jgi:hypothetical protein